VPRMIRSRLTYANVMSSLAVVLVVGGGVSYAAVTLAKNSVGGAQLRKDAVTSAKVKDRSLLAKDFKLGQVPAGKPGSAGSQGPAGAPGPAGPAGSAGPEGPSDGYVTTAAGGPSLGSFGTPTTLATLTLPAGSYLVTGQATLDNGSNTLSASVRCFLIKPDGVTFFSQTRTGLGLNTAFDDIDTATPTGAITLPAAGAVTLRCGYDATTGGSGTIVAFDRRLQAIKVATLTTQ